MAAKPRILSPAFVVLCAAALCFFLSLNILIPTLPQYVDSLGIRPLEIGLVLGAFSFSAIVVRPLVGREIDRRSRKLFASIGLIVSAIACFAYPLAYGLAALLAVRVLHGVAMASFYPGATAYTADITPPSRRAEALSYFSMVLFAGAAVGPSIGEFLFRAGGYRTAFWTASALAVAGFAISLFLPEKHQPKAEGAKAPLLHRAVVFPAATLTLANVAWAAIAYVPLYAATVKGTSGAFYLTSSVTVLIMRLFVGRIADRFGRAVVIVPGTFLVSASMAVIALSPSKPVLIAGAFLFGVGWSALYPGLMSLAIDRVPAWERGSALGTFTVAFDISHGLGSAFLGLILQATNFRMLFLAAGVSAFASGVFFLARRHRSDAIYPALEDSVSPPSEEGSYLPR